jgi:hypothetical protein
MRFLQSVIPDGHARLTEDPVAMCERFRKMLTGVEVRIWSPPILDALPRLLYAFLPPNEGGGDRAAGGAPSRLSRYYREAVPWNMLPPFFQEQNFGGEGGIRIRAQFAGRITQLSLPGQARDLIHRGQFDAATEQLVTLRSQLAKRPVGERELAKSSLEWTLTITKAYANLARAERAAAKGDPAAIAGQEEARGQIDALWKNSRDPMLYVEFLASEPVTAEATYLLGLCKHEQAERQRQGRRGTSDAAPWQAALTWWHQFVNNSPATSATLAARRNLAFALAGAGRITEAQAAFEALGNSDFSPFEKLACKYWASRLK